MNEDGDVGNREGYGNEPQRSVMEHGMVGWLADGARNKCKG